MGEAEAARDLVMRKDEHGHRSIGRYRIEL